MPDSAGSGRILMLLGNNPYPHDPRVRHEAVALASAGYEVTVICPRLPSQPRSEMIDGVRVARYRAPGRAPGAAGYILEYAYATLASLVLSLRVLRRHGFDVVHAHNPPDTFALLGALYKLLGGKRFIFDHHDLAPEMYDARFDGRGSRAVRTVLVLLEKLSCRLADHVIATNRSYRAVEMERGKVAPERITVVRNGPGLGDVHPVEPDLALRARAGAIVGYLGVMGYQDGVDHLLRAMRHLVYDLGRRDALCILIGRGDAKEDLERLARELGIEEHVLFTGFIPVADVVRYLSTADVCVDPDPSNPFNDRSTMIKVMDYMTFARPIVAFDLPENRFTAGEAAHYVRANDDLELARGILELMGDPDRRARMGATGRRRVRSELAWGNSIPPLLAAYRSVIPVEAGRPWKWREAGRTPTWLSRGRRTARAAVADPDST
jgi:glycosyltransferase involved in cell wall biosynthesis